MSEGSRQVASDTWVALLPRVAVSQDAAEYEDDITPLITAKVVVSVIWVRSTLLRYVHFTHDRPSPKTEKKMVTKSDWQNIAFKIQPSYFLNPGTD